MGRDKRLREEREKQEQKMPADLARMAAQAMDVLPADEQVRVSAYFPGPEPVNYKPMHTNVLVARTEFGPEVRHGIQLPDGSNHRNYEGVVVAVGPGKPCNGGFEQMQASVGDYVLYARHDGRDVMINEHIYRIMPEDKLICILPPREVSTASPPVPNMRSTEEEGLPNGPITAL